MEEQRHEELLDCPNCGVELIDGLKFCGQCGHDLSKKTISYSLGITPRKFRAIDDAVDQIITDTDTKSEAILRIRDAEEWSEIEKILAAMMMGGKSENPLYMLSKFMERFHRDSDPDGC